MNTTSTDSLQPGQQPAASSNKPLWAAIGVLGVAVLAMGGTMLYRQGAQPPAANTNVATLSAPPVIAAPSVTTAPVTAVLPADDLVEKPAAAVQPAPVPAPAPPKKVVKHTPKPTPPRELTYSQAPSYASPAPSSYPAPVVAAPVCVMCGSVESVTPVTRATKAPTVGIGSVAGGVLGAVLGNQIGHGNGRAAATVLGAVGGGFAGNAIEGQVRKETVYHVGVRMEDGSHRTMELTHAPGVGSPVTVEGSSLRTRDGATYSP